MREPIVYFGIGFLLAALLILGARVLARSRVGRLARKRLESAAPPNVEIVHYETTKSFLMDVAAKGKALDWLRDQLNGTATQSASAPTPVRSDGAVLK